MSLIKITAAIAFLCLNCQFNLAYAEAKIWLCNHVESKVKVDGQILWGNSVERDFVDIHPGNCREHIVRDGALWGVDGTYDILFSLPGVEIVEKEIYVEDGKQYRAEIKNYIHRELHQISGSVEINEQ